MHNVLFNLYPGGRPRCLTFSYDDGPPEDIRLTEMLRRYNAGETAEQAAAYILERYDEKNNHHWCHTISNADIVALGLLWGEKDFARTMQLCLTMGFDTDCNCATAGSVLGMILGAEKLPKAWTDPLCDTVLSGVDGFGLVKISDMAKRTVKLCAAE